MSLAPVAMTAEAGTTAKKSTGKWLPSSLSFNFAFERDGAQESERYQKVGKDEKKDKTRTETDYSIELKIWYRFGS